MAKDKEITIPAPVVETSTVTTKSVRMNIAPEKVEDIIREWLVRNVPQFRGMPEIDIYFDVGQIFRGVDVHAKRETRN